MASHAAESAPILVKVYPAGESRGKRLRVFPEQWSWEDFLQHVENKLGFAPGRIADEDGAEIDELSDLVAGDKLYVEPRDEPVAATPFTDSAAAKEPDASPGAAVSTGVSLFLESLSTKAPQEKVVLVCKIAIKIISNITEHPMEPKFRRVGKAAIQEPGGVEAVQALEACGFGPDPRKPEKRLSFQGDVLVLGMCLQVLENKVREIATAVTEEAMAAAPAPQQVEAKSADLLQTGSGGAGSFRAESKSDRVPAYVQLEELRTSLRTLRTSATLPDRRMQLLREDGSRCGSAATHAETSTVPAIEPSAAGETKGGAPGDGALKMRLLHKRREKQEAKASSRFMTKSARELEWLRARMESTSAVTLKLDEPGGLALKSRFSIYENAEDIIAYLLECLAPDFRAKISQQQAGLLLQCRDHSNSKSGVVVMAVEGAVPTAQLKPELAKMSLLEWHLVPRGRIIVKLWETQTGTHARIRLRSVVSEELSQLLAM